MKFALNTALLRPGRTGVQARSAPRTCCRHWLTLLALLPGLATAQLQAGADDEYAQLLFDVVLLEPGASIAAAGDPVPGSAAQSPGSPAAEEDDGTAALQLQTLAELEAAIDRAMSTQGLYSPDLREQYQQLAALQQRLGQHDSAIATLEKSVHIARVNDGLYTEDQEADVERILESLEALGYRERIADYRAYLYYMQQRAYEPGDPRLVVAKRAFADWNLSEFQRDSLLDPRAVLLSGGTRPEDLVVVRDQRNGEVRFVPRRNLIGTSTMPGALGDPARYSLTPEMVVDTRLRAAQDIYEELLEADPPVLDAQQREQLRMQLVAGEYALKRQMDGLMGEYSDRSVYSSPAAMSTVAPSMLRRGFSESRDRIDAEILALEAANPPDPLALARLYLRQADLHVAYDERRRADPWYAKAWSSLLQSGMDTTAAAAWLQGAPLQPVPDFVLHPYSRALHGYAMDDTLPYRGYIDLSMNLTRDGNVRSADITDASADTPQRVRRLLLQYLRGQKMRPRLDAQGQPVTTEGLRFRVHYTY